VIEPILGDGPAPADQDRLLAEGIPSERNDVRPGSPFALWVLVASLAIGIVTVTRWASEESDQAPVLVSPRSGDAVQVLRISCRVARNPRRVRRLSCTDA
jgi:hypothetical protein